MVQLLDQPRICPVCKQVIEDAGRSSFVTYKGMPVVFHTDCLYALDNAIAESKQAAMSKGAIGYRVPGIDKLEPLDSIEVRRGPHKSNNYVVYWSAKGDNSWEKLAIPIGDNGEEVMCKVQHQEGENE